MTNNNDPDFYFPSSSSSSLPMPIPFLHHQKLRKKRTKLIKIEPSNVNINMASSTAAATVVSKPKYYAKKPDPSAPKITRPCSECGKKFWSWKALFGHMRCHPERQWRGINPPPNYRRPIIVAPIQEMGNVEGEEEEYVWTAEEREVADCLLLLANSRITDGETTMETDQEEDATCRFECSSCKKVFGSHQALGGHRASHKNVKGCFAITRSDGFEIVDQDQGGGSGSDVKDDNSNSSNNNMLMVLGHKCSICLRVFSSGQALGGHKRCHWEKGEEGCGASGSGSGGGGGMLDLNLPAPVEDIESSSYSSGLTLDLRLGL